MDFRELIDRNTPLASVYPEYIAPRLQKPAQPEQTKPTKQQQDDEATTQKVRFVLTLLGVGLALLLLATVGWTPGGFIVAGWWLAFVFAPNRATVTVNAYLLWTLSHLPGAGILAGLTVTFFTGSLIYGSVTGRHIDPAMILLAVLCGFLFVVAVLGGVLNLIFGRAAEDTVQDEPVEVTAADRIRELLPSVLANYYAPLTSYRQPNPLRSHFSDESEWKQAIAEQNDEIHLQRLEVARSFIVEVAEDEDNDGIVFVTLQVRQDGHDDELQALAPLLRSQLKVFRVASQNPDGPGGTVRFRVETVKLPSLLERLTPPVDAQQFFANNPVTNRDVTPLGVTPYLGVFPLPLHHTSCAGRTGSGKGSFIQTCIYQWMPLIAAGTRRVWLADPKPAEALPYLDAYNRPSTSALHRVATEEEDIVALIFDFHNEMLQQKRTRVGLGRSNDETVDYPGNVLMLDEASSLIDDAAFMSIKNDEGVSMGTVLNNITRKGRSLNFYLFIGAQELTGQPIFKLIKNIPVKLVGYMEQNDLEVARGLGIKERDLPAHADEIILDLPKSAKANGFRYSGIFNSVDADNTFTAMRLPFVSEEMIEARVREFGLDTPNPAALPTLEVADIPNGRGSKPMLRKVEHQSIESVSVPAQSDHIASLLAKLDELDD